MSRLQTCPSVCQCVIENSLSFDFDMTFILLADVHICLIKNSHLLPFQILSMIALHCTRTIVICTAYAVHYSSYYYYKLLILIFYMYSVCVEHDRMHKHEQELIQD